MSTDQPLSTVVNLYALLQTKVLSDGKHQMNVNHTWVTDNVLYVTYYFFIGNKVSWPTAGIENGSAGLIQEKLHDRITLNCQYSMLQTWSC